MDDEEVHCLYQLRARVQASKILVAISAVMSAGSGGAMTAGFVMFSRQEDSHRISYWLVSGLLLSIPIFFNSVQFLMESLRDFKKNSRKLVVAEIMES